MKRVAGYDVVVVGSGPGGAVSAKRCAEAGLRTLMLEKRSLPREKVCTGMIMAPWCREFVTGEFGRVPESVLTRPYRLGGHWIHVPGADPAVLSSTTPIAWRRDLDAWMVRGALRAGAELRDRTRVLHVEQEAGQCRVRIQQGRRSASIRTGCVVGADGAASVVRRAICPGLEVPYSAPVRWFYEAVLDIETEVIHWFFPRSRPRPRFDLVHKGGGVLLEGSGLRSLRAELPRILAPYGFREEMRPAWRDGCLVAGLHRALLDGSFLPARGRVLLVGDAAGVILPVTFEGIGTALESGRLAAGAVSTAVEAGGEPAGVYLESLAPVLDLIRRLWSLTSKLEASADEGSRQLAKAMAAAYLEAMKAPGGTRTGSSMEAPNRSQ